ncbi:MAG: DUF4350 domain-containing protein [Flavobacterium sp.]
MVLILVGIIIIDANKKVPIDWRPSYSLREKIPFGLYVFDQESKSFFSPQKIKKFGETPYEFFDQYYDVDDSTYSVSGTFLHIDNSCTIDNSSVDELLYFVSHGNNAFLSATSFPEKLADSLHFETAQSNSFLDSIQFKTERNHTTNQFYFNKGINDAYFYEIDSTRTTVLGTQSNSKGITQTNFVRIPYKNGAFYLHLQPVAFTNYYLLKENAQYTQEVLGYIAPNETIYWNVNQYENQNLSESPLRYILSKPALRWAWYLSLISLLFFMIFNAKRRQRIVPIKEPLKNTTVDFTKTIGNLYYQEKDHQNIAEKKIVFLLEKIRNEYYIDTFNLDETFINRLHQKTGNDKTVIENVVQLIKKIRNQSQTTEKELIIFNELLEKLNL